MEEVLNEQCSSSYCQRRRSSSSRGTTLTSTNTTMIFLVVILLLRLDCHDAFCTRPIQPQLATITQLHHHITFQQHDKCKKFERERIKLQQMMGPGGDYLSQLSSNNLNEQDDNESQISQDKNDVENNDKNILGPRRGNPISSVQSALSSVSKEVGKRTSEITSGISNVSNKVGQRTMKVTSGIASAAERGSSDIQSLANKAQSNVMGVAKRGTRDLKRTTLRAQKVVKQSTGTLGQELSDINFFRETGNSFVTFPEFESPKMNIEIVKAEEIVQWIDSQAKSGTEMVGSNAKRLVLNFTGKKEYQFGDVTKELIHRVASQEVNMQDTILLLKVSGDVCVCVLARYCLYNTTYAQIEDIISHMVICNICLP